LRRVTLTNDFSAASYSGNKAAWSSSYTLNRNRLISGGTMFASGKFVGGGGKTLAVFENNIAGTFCNSQSEVTNFLSGTTVRNPSTVTTTSLSVTSGPLSPQFSSFSAPQTTPLALYSY